jgi:hypothetical protein
VELIKMTPVVELSEAGEIIIDNEKIAEYIAAHGEMAHMGVRDFFTMLAELSEAAPAAEVGS